jgi:hypothetical protein
MFQDAGRRAGPGWGLFFAEGRQTMNVLLGQEAPLNVGVESSSMDVEEGGKATDRVIAWDYNYVACWLGQTLGITSLVDAEERSVRLNR